jgi:hypothetical protein
MFFTTGIVDGVPDDSGLGRLQFGQDVDHSKVSLVGSQFRGRVEGGKGIIGKIDGNNHDSAGEPVHDRSPFSISATLLISPDLSRFQ